MAPLSFSTPNNITMSDASIPIPPGMTVDQYLEAEELATNLRIVAGVILGLFLWDYVVLFPSEVKLYRLSNSSTLKKPAFWLFVILRYSPFLAASSAIAFSSFNVNDCQSAANVSFAGVLLMQFASSGIFLLRILVLMQQPFTDIFKNQFTLKKGLCLAAIILFITNTACWIAVMPGYTFTTGPHTRYGSNCLNPTTYSWSALSYGTSFLYDSYIIALTIYCHVRMRKNGADLTGIMSLIARDGALYFLFATICNLIAFSMNVLPSNLSYYKSFATPFASFAVTTMGQRVFLNLRLMDTQTKAHNNGRATPQNSSTSTSGTALSGNFGGSSSGGGSVAMAMGGDVGARKEIPRKPVQHIDEKQGWTKHPDPDYADTPIELLEEGRGVKSDMLDFTPPMDSFTVFPSLRSDSPDGTLTSSSSP